MQKFFLSLATLVALATGSAFAADLPVAPPVYQAPPYVAPPPLYDWRGFYVGINGGYGLMDPTGSSTCVTPTGLGCDQLNANTLRPGGGVAGAQVGYNWQTGLIAYGVETDLQWAGIKMTSTVTDLCCNSAPPAFVTPGTYTATTSLDWFGTARVRAGFAADQVLFYATGGLIYGGVKVANFTAWPAGAFASSANAVHAGWTAGAGIEGGFTENLTGRVEALYYDMGTLSSQFTNPAVGGLTVGGTSNFKGFIARAGLNWKFTH